MGTNIFARYKDIVWVIIVCLVIILMWFKDGGVLAGAEEGLQFYNLDITQKMTSEIWLPGELGVVSITDFTRKPFFQILHLFSAIFSNTLLSAGTVFVCMFLGSLGIYLLAYETLEKRLGYKYISLISAVLYLLNPFSMSQVWGRGIYFQYMAFAHIPLFTYFMVMIINTGKLSYGLLALLTSFMLSGTFGHPTYMITTWVPSGVYLLITILSNKLIWKRRFTLIANLILFFICWLVIQSWWLVPNILISKDLYFSDQYFTNNTNNEIENLRALSKSAPLQTILRLMHDGYFIWSKTYDTFYLNPFVQLCSWLLAIFLLIGIFLSNKKIIRFYLVLLFIGLFISLGSNLPFGWFFEKLFIASPILRAFRNPYEKFGLVYLLAYIPLLSLGISILVSSLNSELKKRLSIFLILGFLAGFLIWPLWTGKTISWGKNIVVPEYYEQANNYIKSINNTDRIFFLPFIEGWGGSYNWQDSEYHGADPQRSIFNNPVVSTNADLEIFMYLRHFIGQMDISPILSMMGINFVIDRHDLIITKPYGEQAALVLQKYYRPKKDSYPDLMQICSEGSALEGNDLKCILSGDKRNLSLIRYIHLVVDGQKDDHIKLGLIDSHGVRRLWNYPKSVKYEVKVGSSELVIPMFNPNEAPDQFDITDVAYIQLSTTNNSQLSLRGLRMDRGDGILVDKFDYVSRFGALELYRLRLKPAPEVRSLSSLEIAPKVDDIFERVSTSSAEVLDKGYIAKSQNLNLAIQDIPVAQARINSFNKISDDRYIFRSEGDGPLLVVLNKTFSPGWRVVKIKGGDDLVSSLDNNIKILTGEFLGRGSQYKVNGFANLWILDKSGDYGIVFYHQVLLDTLWMIAIPTILLIVITLSGLIIYERKR